MPGEAYTTESAKRTAEAALAGGPGGAVVANIVLREVGSPWGEKARVLFRRRRREAVFYVWRSPQFLTARIHRLALYTLDSLDPRFEYDRDSLATLESAPRTRQIHNHIWSIYVDSRIEKMGLENFFDRVLRRNLFVDSQKAYPWSLSSLFFQKLWEKESFTHPEIIDYAQNLDGLIECGDAWDSDAFEVEINRSVGDRSVREHIDNMLSPELRAMADALLAFVKTRCRGTLIEPSYYGIYFMYDQEIFAEMITTKKDALLLTLFDFHSEKRTSYAIGSDPKDMGRVQGAIKEIYDAISRHSYLKIIKDPYGAPIGK